MGRHASKGMTETVIPLSPETIDQLVKQAASLRYYSSKGLYNIEEMHTRKTIESFMRAIDSLRHISSYAYEMLALLDDALAQISAADIIKNGDHVLAAAKNGNYARAWHENLALRKLNSDKNAHE